jgi:SAM-dependent methyltransferase
VFKLIKKCRVCGSKKIRSVLNLGNQPPANSLQKIKKNQSTIPLNMLRCSSCYTLQLNATIKPSHLFSKYLWVTGTSEVIKRYRDFFVRKIKKNHSSNSRNLLEIASNDGFFLKEFKKNKFNILGIDPAKNIAKIANAQNIPTIAKFFNLKISKIIKKKYFSFDIVVCRNVIPHVENIHSVVSGIANVLSKNGKAYIEFHYAENLNKNLHYDYIYHEHIFYFTLLSMTNLLKKHNLNVLDYFKSPISGGSLVLVVSKMNSEKSNRLKKLIAHEIKNKVNKKIYWKNFSNKCIFHKNLLKKKLEDFVSKKLTIAGYGASARSSTLLNYCKITNKQLKFVADKSPIKKNLFTAGSGILIKNPTKSIFKDVNCIFILAWNFKDEIMRYLKKIKFKGTIITVLPKIKITKC